MNTIELAKEADIYVAHLNKPMTDKEVRLAFPERFAALVRAEYEAPLKLAEEALEYARSSSTDQKGWGYYDKALQGLYVIREPLAEHSGDANEMVAETVEQEPVFWVHPMDFGRECGVTPKQESDELIPLYAAPLQPVKQEPVEVTAEYLAEVVRLVKSGNMSLTPIPCCAPVDAKAIRAEALEEAAKVCDEQIKHDWNIPHKPALVNCAAAIRSLK